MEKLNDKEIVKIASMYYEEGLTQAEIARQRGVSRSLISKILMDAKNEGIVEIIINSENAYTASIERKLEKQFNLKNAIIIDSFNLSHDEIKKMASQQAALYLKSIVEDYRSIGISWGNSLRGLVDHFPFINHPDVSVLPLIGGLSDDYFDIQSNQLCYDLARKMRGKAKYLYAPALVSNQVLHEELSNNRAIQSVLEEGRFVELALVGISSLDQETNMRRIGYLSVEDVSELAEKEVVGVINSRFFDKTGTEVKADINQNVLGVSLTDLADIPLVMTVVYGDRKAEAVKTALDNRLINVLVTTDTLAEKIVDQTIEEENEANIK
ncbi:sugar-binding transcriptional regulator [Fundicoccus sp. Sow4_D5]|uniref:sugar-binding transcriptional regulator n=1 Tax=unclassified Fundicoccus TaxID=2761543 RepID=UPI003F8FDFCE